MNPKRPIIYKYSPQALLIQEPHQEQEGARTQAELGWLLLTGNPGSGWDGSGLQRNTSYTCLELQNRKTRMVCSQQLDCTYGQVQQHFNSMGNESENQLARRMCCTGEKIQCNTRHPVNRIASRTGPITSRNQGLAQTLVQQLQLCKDAPPTYYYIHTWRYYMNPFNLEDLLSWTHACVCQQQRTIKVYNGLILLDLPPNPSAISLKTFLILPTI